MNTFKIMTALSLLFLLPTIAKADRDHHFFSGKQECYNRENIHSWEHGRNYQSNHWQTAAPYGERSSRFDPLITSGIRSGRLSPAEVRELRERQRDIKREEIFYWADGRLSSRERKDLRNDYQDWHRHLEHELNDGERGRFTDGWRW